MGNDDPVGALDKEEVKNVFHNLMHEHEVEILKHLETLRPADPNLHLKLRECLSKLGAPPPKKDLRSSGNNPPLASSGSHNRNNSNNNSQTPGPPSPEKNGT